jgi:hypothetical protein
VTEQSDPFARKWQHSQLPKCCVSLKNQKTDEVPKEEDCQLIMVMLSSLFCLYLALDGPVQSDPVQCFIHKFKTTIFKHQIKEKT